MGAIAGRSYRSFCLFVGEFGASFHAIFSPNFYFDDRRLNRMSEGNKKRFPLWMYPETQKRVQDIAKQHCTTTVIISDAYILT
jgi:hypothetical protein